MRILFLSDIHGSLPALDAALDYFDAHHYELLVLLGDLLNYGPRNGVPQGLDAPGIAALLNRHAGHTIAVRGNCDSEVDQMLLRFPIMADYALIADGTRRIFLTHGHVFNEEQMPALEGIDYFFYGHTHLPHIVPAADGRPLICNTGSPTFPKGGNEPTVALYEDGKVSLLKIYE